MRALITVLFTFISLITFSQDILSFDEIYTENNLVYKKSNSNLFTGKVQRFKKKNHLVFEIEIENGVMKIATIFYNGKEKKEAEKRYYDLNNKIFKKEKYSFDKTYVWTTLFNNKEEKILEEEHENGVLKYRSEYLNGKKHGITYSLNDDGTSIECLFENGKILKKYSK